MSQRRLTTLQLISSSCKNTHIFQMSIAWMSRVKMNLIICLTRGKSLRTELRCQLLVMQASNAQHSKINTIFSSTQSVRVESHRSAFNGPLEIILLSKVAFVKKKQVSLSVAIVKVKRFEVIANIADDCSSKKLISIQFRTTASARLWLWHG